MIPNLPPRLTPDEQADVARRMVEARDAIAAGDASAETKAEFIEARNALAVDVAARGAIDMAFGHPLVSAHCDDAIQDAFLSALEACGDFDPTRAAKPTTHLWWWLRAGLYHHLRVKFRQTDRFATGFEFEAISDHRTGDDPAEADAARHAAACLEGLPGREAAILRHRFGIGEAPMMTLEAIGARLGVSKERVRQLEAQALSRLRRAAS